MLDIEKMTLLELKELAKEHNIRNISKLKKDELVTVLKQIINQNQEIAQTSKEEIIIEEVEEVNKRQYDANGEPIVDYKLTSDEAKIFYQVKKMFIYQWFKLEDSN